MSAGKAQPEYGTAGGASGVGLEGARALFASSPHGRLIGADLVDSGDRWVQGRVAWREDLVGNPETGVLHGGVVTTLIDHCSGAAVLLSVGRGSRIVTLDLRVDHLAAARPGSDIHARAECYRLAREVAFVRCVAFQTTADAPFATSMSSFMHMPEG